jgi:hypothetical protein
MTTIHEKTEEVRERAYATAVAHQEATGEDCELDFYGAAFELGCTHDDCERISGLLTMRAMRVRGGI